MTFFVKRREYFKKAVAGKPTTVFDKDSEIKTKSSLLHWEILNNYNYVKIMKSPICQHMFPLNDLNIGISF